MTYPSPLMPVTNSLEFFIQWHLTEKCNLRCSHCYQARPVPNEMTLPQIKETIAEASDMISAWSELYGISFNRSMNLSGGEPFLRADLFDVIEEVKRAGFDVSLLTNGTLIGRDRAEALANLGVDAVQVSIEGPEAVHDGIRGRGSYAAATAGVANLAASGLAVTLNVTISRLNAEEVKNVARLGADMGVARVGFSRLVPSGNGEGLMDQMLAPGQLQELYLSLRSFPSDKIEIVSGDPVAAQIANDGCDDAGDTPTGGCAAGLSGLTIMPDGTVLPCRRLPVPLGNVRTDSLRELWATSPVLEALRDRSRYRGACGTCGRWARCRGCRAVAYAMTGEYGKHDFLADDPQCFLKQG